MNSPANEFELHAHLNAVKACNDALVEVEEIPDIKEARRLRKENPSRLHLITAPGSQATKLLKEYGADPNQCVIAWQDDPETEMFSLLVSTAPWTTEEVIQASEFVTEDVLELALREFIAIAGIAGKTLDDKVFELDAEVLMVLMGTKSGNYVEGEGFGFLTRKGSDGPTDG